MDTKNSDDSAGSDSLDKSLQKKCVVDDVGQGEGVSGNDEKKPEEEAPKVVTTESAVENRIENSAKKQKTDKNVGDGSGGGGSDTNINASTSNAGTVTATQLSSNNNAFETKVKQISKNLKDTTLAESGNKKTSLEDFNSTASSSSSTSASSSTTSTPECEQAVGESVGDESLTGAVNSDDLVMATTSGNPSQDGDVSLFSSTNESIDEHDHRSKKVRFHPDVKENDGGNRVIPKKKKLKSSHGASSEEASTSSNQRGSADEEMELDEEEEIEEEEEFDLAKTIAEAKDYLKTHPLTFVRPFDKNSGRLQNGLLEEEDLPQLSESSEEEDVYDNVAPENGIERILGKQIKCGKVEFLLRYAERSGLGWETEDIIAKQCPNLLNKYEQNRERRQERLMRHVAKRQNIRQRYTDF